MELTTATIGSVERGFDRCLRALPVEAWCDDHDWAMRCHDMEEAIAGSLPLLAEFLSAWRVLLSSLAAANTLDSDNRRALSWICRMMPLVREKSLSKLEEIERAGYEVARADAFRELFQEISATLDPVLRNIALSMPSADGNDRISEALENLHAVRQATAVKSRPRKVRLPDPPFETGEGPAPFDLPLPGTWVPMKARRGKVRLPDPIDFDECEGTN